MTVLIISEAVLELEANSMPKLLAATYN